MRKFIQQGGGSHDKFLRMAG